MALTDSPPAAAQLERLAVSLLDDRTASDADRLLAGIYLATLDAAGQLAALAEKVAEYEPLAERVPRSPAGRRRGGPCSEAPAMADNDTGGDGGAAVDSDTAVFSADERAEIVSLVRDAVRDSVVALLGDDDDDTATDDDAVGSGSGAAGRADLEGATEDAVRRAMARIERDKELSGRLEAIEKVVKEDTPLEVRRLTSFLWGSNE